MSTGVLLRNLERDRKARQKAKREAKRNPPDNDYSERIRPGDDEPQEYAPDQLPF